MAGPASIIGVNAIRVARLNADGTPDFDNPQGGFMLCGGISTFEHSFEKQTGADIYVEDAAGNPCVVRKRPDRVKRVSFTLTVCRNDYRLQEILGVADAVDSGEVTVGVSVNTSVGCDTPAPNPVSLELWSEQWDCDAFLADQPYQRIILPMAYLTPDGFTRQNGESLPKFTGYSSANANWGDGPFGDADVLSGTTFCYAEIDDPTVPTCPEPVGYINVPGSAS